MTELEFKRYCKQFKDEGYDEISRSAERAVYLKVLDNTTKFVELLIEEEKPRVTILSDNQMEVFLTLMDENTN